MSREFPERLETIFFTRGLRLHPASPSPQRLLSAAISDPFKWDASEAQTRALSRAYFLFPPVEKENPRILATGKANQHQLLRFSCLFFKIRDYDG